VVGYVCPQNDQVISFVRPEPSFCEKMLGSNPLDSRMRRVLPKREKGMMSGWERMMSWEITSGWMILSD